MRKPAVLLILFLIMPVIAGFGYWLGQREMSLPQLTLANDGLAPASKRRRLSGQRRDAAAQRNWDFNAIVGSRAPYPGDVVKIGPTAAAALEAANGLEPYKTARRMQEPQFTLPLVYSSGNQTSTNERLTLAQARKLVPRAFAAPQHHAGSFRAMQQVHANDSGGVDTAEAAEAAKDELQMARNLETLRIRFEEAVRASGVPPESPQYLEVWAAAQIAIDRQFITWYGADLAMARQADAYKSAVQQARAAMAR